MPSESTFLRAARSSEILVCRMIISEVGDWAFQGKGIRSARNGDESQLGGVEIRRKDWANVREKVRRMTSFEWDNKMVYVVSCSCPLSSSSHLSH